MQRLARLVSAWGARAAGLAAGTGGAIDGLLQAFENCRAGLPDEAVRGDGAAAREYFTEIYEKERPRLVEALRAQSVYLSAKAQDELVEGVDDRIRRVVIPAYARLTGPFTRRERNDFYVAPDGWHGIERAGWILAGLLAGLLMVRAIFLPLWIREWSILLFPAGFLLPSLRRYFAFKRYEAELNRLAVRAEREITRLDLALMAGAAPKAPVAIDADPTTSDGGTAPPPPSRTRSGVKKEGA